MAQKRTNCCFFWQFISDIARKLRILYLPKVHIFKVNTQSLCMHAFMRSKSKSRFAPSYICPFDKYLRRFNFMKSSMNTCINRAKFVLLILIVLTPLSEMSAQVITVTKQDSLVKDATNNMKADPGDSLRYKITIAVSGDTAKNVMLDTMNFDPNLTLDASSVHISPLARKDSFDAIGNVGLNVLAANGLLQNDVDIDNLAPAGLAIVMAGVATPNTAPGVEFMSGQGGKVTVQSSGAFTYDPALGFSGLDMFVYALSDGDPLTPDRQAKVVIKVSGVIWFVNNVGGGSGGTGTLSDPFETLADFTTANVGGVGKPDIGHAIFVHTGGGDYLGGTSLLNDQKLIGQGASADLATIAGITLPPHSDLPATAGADPVIVNSTGDGITMASGNLVRGLNVGTTMGMAIKNEGMSSVGNLTISEVAITGNGGALNVSDGGNLTVTLESVSSASHSGSLINLAGGVTGTLNVLGGTASGITGNVVNIDGGSVSMTYSGGLSQSNNASLVNVTGGHNGGILTFNTGALSATGGNGLRFNNADGTYNFNGATSLNGGDAGIDILNGSTGTFTFGTGTSITNPTGQAFTLLDSDAGVTYSGSISDEDDVAVSINNHDAQTITFQTGTIVSNGTGIRVLNCNGGTINFNGNLTLNTGANNAVSFTNNSGGSINTMGTLDIDVTTARGFNATGGGTITVQGANNTINSTTGHAVFISGTNIGANDVTFASIVTGGGGSNTGGIFLKNTGTVAGSAFIVNGGTIQNAKGGDLAVNGMSTTGDGICIYLENVQNVTLNGVTVTNSDNFGIRGFGISGTTTLTNVTVNGAHGTTAIADEASLSFNGLTGTLNVTGGTFSGGHEDVFSIDNTTGSLTGTFLNSTFNASSVTTGDNGLQFITSGNGTGNLNVNGCMFNAARAVMLFVDIGGTGGGSTNIGGVMANTFTQNQANLPGGGAIEVLASGSGNGATVTSTISNNTILAGTNTFEGDVIVVGTTFGFAGVHNLTLVDNQIGTNGVNGSAVNPTSGSGDNGMVITGNGTGTIKALVHSNDIYDFNTDGIEVIFDAEGPSDPNGGSMQLNITSNTIGDASGASGGAIFVLGDDVVDACVHIANNTLDNPTNREIVVDVFGASGGFYRVPGLVTLTEVGIESHYTSNNTLIAPAEVKVFTLSPSMITSSAGCTMP